VFPHRGTELQTAEVRENAERGKQEYVHPWFSSLGTKASAVSACSAVQFFSSSSGSTPTLI
jgi:hypothetical protein